MRRKNSKLPKGEIDPKTANAFLAALELRARPEGVNYLQELERLSEKHGVATSTIERRAKEWFPISELGRRESNGKAR